jgi:hypothetical protein
VCSATANLVWGSHEPSRRSHKTLDSLFLTAGVPGPPPGLGHTEKWKDWLFAAGQEPDVDSLTVLGNILEEFMDVPPTDFDARAAWKTTVFGITAVEESSPMGKRRTTPQRLKRPETYQSLPRSKNFY